MKYSFAGAAALLLSTALAAPAAADSLEVSVGGKYAIGAFYRGGEDFPTDEGVEILRDGEVIITARGTLDNGITFRAQVEIESFTDTDQIDENFVRIGTQFGEFMIGADDTAADKHREGWFNPPENIIGYFNSDVSDIEPSTEGDDLSIRYTTPRISGFQAAFSYGIDGTDALSDAGRQTEITGGGDIFSFGASYRGDVGPVELRLGGGIVAINSAGSPDVTWTFGGEVYTTAIGPGELGLAAHYDDNGSDLEESTISGGIQYEVGPWTFAGGYTRELFSGTDNQTYAAWVEYALAPGVTAVFGYEGNNTTDSGIDTFDNIVGGYLDLQF
ncbi:MAG: porin [Pseudomonadota bacterium]